MELTNLDLKFQRRARGIAPLYRFAVADDGGVLVAVPDEMEVRTFHSVRYETDGRAKILDTYSVETLRKTEMGTDSTGIGITEDDLYLFAEGRKTRFLEGRRVSYTDVSLAADGRRFVAAFSDLLAGSHSLALGDNKGRLVWTKDTPFAITRVATDRAGAFVAVASEGGDLWLLDAWRNPVLRHIAPAAVTALFTNGPGEGRTVYGTAGGVGVTDATGGILWYTELPGETVEVVADAAGTVFAALLHLDGSAGRLVFLSHDGLPLWELDYEEARPTGLSLSANGRYAAVTQKDGALTLYELAFGDAAVAWTPDAALVEARQCAERGDYPAALATLRRRLDAAPADADACDAFRTFRTEFRTRCFASSANAEAVGDFATADSHLGEVINVDPLDADAVAQRQNLRQRWAAAARTAGEVALQTGDGRTAEVRFLEAIAADPLDSAARTALAEARRAAADAAIIRGRGYLATGNYAEAITAFTEAQDRGATGPEPTALLRSARAGDALRLGNDLYRDRQYAAAVFQFKKTLRFDPENGEARQKLGYAQTFLRDTALNDRFSRLE